MSIVDTHLNGSCLKRPSDRILSGQMRRAFGGIHAGRRYVPPDADTRSFLERLQSWVFIASDKNATETGRQRLRLYRRKHDSRKDQAPTKSITAKQLEYLKTAAANVPDDAVEVLDHPAINLMYRPNPSLDRCGFFWLVTVYLQTFGESFVHKYRNGLGQPAELWPLPNPFVRPILGDTNLIDHYEFRVGSEIVNFKPEDMMHFRNPSPFDMVGGMSQLRGILFAVETNQRMLEWQNAVFQNYGVPDTLVSAEEDVSQEDVERLIAQWNSDYGGWHNRGKTAIAPFPVKVDRMEQTADELKFIEGRRITREEILSAYGVPLTIVTTDGATFANMGQGLQLWQRNTIEPILFSEAGTLNNSLMRDYDPASKRPEWIAETAKWFFAFDTPLLEDEAAKAEELRKDVAGSMLSINEARDRSGMDGVEGGDEIRIPAGTNRLTDPTAAELSVQLQAEQLQRFRDEGRQEGQQQTETAGAVDAAAASETEVPFDKVVAAMSQFAELGDIDAFNVARDRVVELLGGIKVPEIDTLVGKPGTASVNEDETADDMPAGPGQPGPGEQEEEEEKKPLASEDEDEKDESKQKDHGTGRGGPEERLEWFEDTPLTKAIHDLCVKLTFNEIDQTQKEDSFEAVLRRLFDDMQKDVVHQLIENQSKQVIPPDSVPTLGLFDAAEWMERFGDAAKPFIEHALHSGADAGVDNMARMGVDIASDDFKLLSPELLQQKIAELSVEFASKVVDVTGQDLVPAMQLGVELGENVQQLSSRVAAIFGRAKDHRATRIARTELANAANHAAMAIWSQNDIQGKEWLASVDACEFCLKLHGQKVPINQAFLVQGDAVRGVDGGMYLLTYKTIDAPTLHPYCQCTIKPVLEME